MIHWDAGPGYVVAFSTRTGGVSTGPYDSLNLGLLTDDAPANVQENRRRLCERVGADPARLAQNRQVHGDRVNEAIAGERGRDGDGLWTNEPDVPIVALSADCLPVALAATDGEPRLAVLHVGRAGLLDGIVRAGRDVFDGAAVRAVIGPGIGPCCYEVGDEIRAAYHARFGEAVIHGRRLDLWTATELALRESGVADVERADLCTACNPELFFSHRRDAGVTGRQGVIGYVA